MSTEKLAEATTAALNRRDLQGFLDCVHPEVEFTSMIAEVEAETFRGHDGVRRWWELVRSRMEDAEWRYGQLEIDGDVGVAQLWIDAKVHDIPVSQHMWQVVEARDGKAYWWAFFRSEEEAREAAADRRGTSSQP